MLPKAQGNATGSWPSTGTLKYPRDYLIEDQTDYVKFEFYKYNPPFSAEAFDINTNNLAGYNTSASSLDKIGPKILMYMPEDVGVKYGANWGDKNISNAGRTILGSTGDAMKNSISFEMLGNAANAVGTALTGAAQQLGDAVTKGTATIGAITEALKATGFDTGLEFNDVLGSVTGQILNPNTEVLYTGPQMRGFGLSFKLAPRNKPEADEIKKIIQAFKYAILPKFNGDASQIRAFVGVPSICDVSFMKGSSEHPYVTQFKPCAITGFDVSYTPDGAWATYADGQPVATTISIEFKELKMLYAEELNNDGATY